MKAKTVAQVVAAEAGGETRAERLSAMKDVFSAMYNRAVATGVSLLDVVAGSKQFTAYNHRMPKDTENFVGLAEQAMKEVQENGPTHKGTFYARSYATKNLPKGLSKIKTAVDDHVYYSDPKNRAIITAAGTIRPTQATTDVASAAPAPAQESPGGLLSSFFGPSSAAADEGPGGIMSSYAPEISAADVERSKANAPTDGSPYSGPGSTFTAGDVSRSRGYGATNYVRPEHIAPNAPGYSNEADIQRMEREAGMYQPGGIAAKGDRLARTAADEAATQQLERDAGMYQPGTAAAKGDRLGSNLAAKGDRVGTGAFSQAPGGLMASNTDMSKLGATVGSMVPHETGGMLSDTVGKIGGLLGSIGDAYGMLGPNSADASIDPSTYTPSPSQSAPAPNVTSPGGLRDASRLQRESLATRERAAQERAAGVPQADAVFHDLPDYTPPDQEHLHIGGIQPTGATEAAAPVGPEATVVGSPPSSLFSPNPVGQLQRSLAAPQVGGLMAQAAMPDMEKANAFTPQIGGLMQGIAPPTAEPKTIEDAPTIAAPEDTAAADENTFPAAPEPSFRESNPKTARALKDIALGGLLGGLPGAAIGGVRGLLGDRMNRPTFDGAVPQSDRFSVGSGLSGINAALGGPRGATAKSLSNPGMSVTSLGNGQSLRRSEKYGWTEVVGPDGSVVGIKYDDPESKGILGRISKGVGGIMGGRGYGISPGAQHAIDSGKGGLY